MSDVESDVKRDVERDVECDVKIGTQRKKNCLLAELAVSSLEKMRM